MNADPFTDRLARVRDRFAASLTAKIEDTCAAVPQFSAAGQEAAAASAALGEAYRCVHGMVGVGPTVGFPQTGRAAHAVEDVLRAPYREGRGLAISEIALLTGTLQTLREAATRELQAFHSPQQ